MRILFITAFYPPYVVGGWEQLVQDINARLRSRGHMTMVLTSNHGVGSTPLQQQNVKRLLHLEADLVRYNVLDFLLRYREQERENIRVTREMIEEFKPDIVFVHVMWNLTKAIPHEAERLLPGRVVYYVANDWPYTASVHRAFWEDPAGRPLRRLLKAVLKPMAMRTLVRMEAEYPLEFRHVWTVSDAQRRDLLDHTDIPPENVDVLYNGVEIDLFRPSRLVEPKDGLTLLYAGSLVSHKGVHTAIEALNILKENTSFDDTTLTIVGSGHPGYENRLQRMVEKMGLQDRVYFWPRVAREEMPVLLRKFEVLLFPSIWKEPLARMMQEAMAAGLVVVGTPTGGTPEILKDGETGLTFEPGNAEDLARQIARLHDTPELSRQLAESARALVEDSFSLDRMILEIEDGLEKVVSTSTPSNVTRGKVAERLSA